MFGRECVYVKVCGLHISIIYCVYFERLFGLYVVCLSVNLFVLKVCLAFVLYVCQ